MFAPNWVFEIAVMRTASEFLSSEIGIEAFGKKYAEGLSKLYSTPIEPEFFTDTAQSVLEFLSEVEAGEQAVELLNDFCYFRLYNEGVNRPRKMRSMFGSVEDAVKTKEYSPETALKSFKAYVFGLRSNTVPTAPDGWKIETDEHIELLKPLLEEQVSILDIF